MSELRHLFNLHNSDKARKHSYELVYDSMLGTFRDDTFSLLEIGIYQGASLRCWLDYFTRAKIFGVDIKEEFLINENRLALRGHPRAKICFADSKCGNPFPGETYRVIIDDGDHNLSSQLETFHQLSKCLSHDGIYFIEDVRKSCTYKQPDGSLVTNTPEKFDLLIQGIEDQGFRISVGDSSCKYPDGSKCHILICRKEKIESSFE